MKNILKNKWFRFALATAIYVLWFVVWMRNGWMLLGLPVIFDLCVTGYINRYALDWHRRARAKSGVYRVAAEWVEAVVFAAVVASVIHIFVFQMFTIPTPSMEKSLLVGDYLYVSKLAYGPKIPNTPLSFPLAHNTMPFSKTGAKSYSEVIRRPYKRLAGPGRVERDDVVVFNFPAGDTVLLENLGVTYYDVVREYVTRYGAKEGRARLAGDYTIVARPVDKRENFVKRCVALPGDSIRVADARLYVNGVVQKEIPGLQQVYYMTTSEPFSGRTLTAMGIARADIQHNPQTGEYVMPLTAANLEKMRGMDNVLTVERYQRGGGLEIFPNAPGFGWTENDFGPIWIPARGETVVLTVDNLPLYERIIDVYEGNDLRVERDGNGGGTIYINGVVATSYTFEMDYYWMMGDNRQNSADSRFWGFVPEDHVVGKASFVWLSLDAERGWFDGKIRWSRMFRRIK
ncbi:MAG: signal peptidase I [Alistipes sp.]|jgi:signal peptidase I|nr:signal peptidase I [Alistipes sp.]